MIKKDKQTCFFSRLSSLQSHPLWVLRPVSYLFIYVRIQVLRINYLPEYLGLRNNHVQDQTPLSIRVLTVAQVQAHPPQNLILGRKIKVWRYMG